MDDGSPQAHDDAVITSYLIQVRRAARRLPRRRAGGSHRHWLPPHRARRRDKSEGNTPAGSTAARSRRKSSNRWYILGISSARVLKVLARENRPPASST